MRALLAGCALLFLGTAVAEAQPYYGYGHPPGWGWRHPHPPGWGYGPGWRRGPGWGPYHRRCFWVEGYYGPHRVCRGW